MLATAVSRALVMLSLPAIVLFASAGRLDVSAFWAYLGVLLGASFGAVITTLRNDPTLIEERLRPGPGGQDCHLRGIALTIFALHFAVAGLDVGRFHWSGSVPLVVQVTGLIAVAVSLALAAWAVAVNRFFSSVVRIQRDRGHRLITAGPYRVVRHPGYAGALLMIVSSGFALGSYVAVLVALPAAGFIVRRLLREERLLHAELEGYEDYAERVRYRVVPRVW